MDHVSIKVRDYDKSKAFYDATLAQLKFKRLMTLEKEEFSASGYGKSFPSFWISSGHIEAATDTAKTASGKPRGPPLDTEAEKAAEILPTVATEEEGSKSEAERDSDEKAPEPEGSTGGGGVGEGPKRVPTQASGASGLTPGHAADRHTDVSADTKMRTVEAIVALQPTPSELDLAEKNGGEVEGGAVAEGGAKSTGGAAPTQTEAEREGGSKAAAPEALRNSDAGTHFAFAAPSVEAIEAWYYKALELGATDNGKPGPRSYHPGYYAAFVIDPDGWRLEACLHHHRPGGWRKWLWSWLWLPSNP